MQFVSMSTLMKMSNPQTRKSCIVPKCLNTTTNAPEKLFFIVPFELKIRKKWMQIMKRADPPGDKSCVYCCEDHFDIESDMENYVKYKLVGGRIKLKKRVLPHKFDCQKPMNVKPERSAVHKRGHIKFLEKLSHDCNPSTSAISEEAIPEAVFVTGFQGDGVKEDNNGRCMKRKPAAESESQVVVGLSSKESQPIVFEFVDPSKIDEPNYRSRSPIESKKMKIDKNEPKYLDLEETNCNPDNPESVSELLRLEEIKSEIKVEYTELSAEFKACDCVKDIKEESCDFSANIKKESEDIRGKNFNKDK